MPPETDTSTGGTPGAGGTPEQEGSKSKSQTTSGTGGTPGNGGTPDQSQGAGEDTTGLRNALSATRDENRTLKERLKALEEKDLPDAERSKRRLQELEDSDRAKTARLQDLQMQNQAIRLAGQLGFADADDALGWLAINRHRVDFDPQGTPSNLEALLKDLLKTKPHLAGTARPSGSADGGPRGQGTPIDMNSRIRRAAGRRSSS